MISRTWTEYTIGSLFVQTSIFVSITIFLLRILVPFGRAILLTILKCGNFFTDGRSVSSDDSSSYGFRTSELTKLLFNSQHNTPLEQELFKPFRSTCIQLHCITFLCGVCWPLFVCWSFFLWSLYWLSFDLQLLVS